MLDQCAITPSYLKAVHTHVGNLSFFVIKNLQSVMSLFSVSAKETICDVHDTIVGDKNMCKTSVLPPDVYSGGGGGFYIKPCTAFR